LPSHISLDPLNPTSPIPRPDSHLSLPLHSGHDTKPFYEITRILDRKGIVHDVAKARNMIEKIIEVGGRGDKLMVMAYGEALLRVVEFSPLCADEFQRKG
ncbi:hypothetical protein BGZ60DRAFT_378093, partial [Tricladium varicosporioides]